MIINDTKALKEFILKCLNEKKAENIDVIDLTEKQRFVDYIIFASGRSTRNVAAIADHVALELKNKAKINANIEGLAKSEWVLIDVGTILINIFYPTAREYYKLEEFWKSK